MTEEEKKNFKHIKERAEYVSENILGTNVFTTYDVYCVNMLIEIIQKQDTEINKLNKEIKQLKEDISNMYDEKVVRNILEDYCDLSKDEIEELLN